MIGDRAMLLRPNGFARRLVVDEIQHFGGGSAGVPAPGSSGPYRIGTATRRRLRADEGDGYEDLVHVSDGLYLMVCNRLRTIDECSNYVGEGVLKLHFRLAGRSSIILEDGAQVQIEGAYCGVMLHPAGMDKGEIDHAGVAERWATVLCRSEFLRDSLGVEIDEMPQPLRRFMNGQSYDLYQRALPLTPMMSHSLGVLLDSPIQGALRNVQTEGQCLDLVSHVLDALRRSSAESGAARLSRRDAECVRHAREILEREFATPPTLQLLARRIGINQNKLNQGFRLMFGITAGDFVTECRMQHAHRLLQQGERSVAQVAYAVGYEFPGNFTTAFKRYFGVPPRTTRARTRAVD
jgi:AraC-like DNA-binding protein